MKNIEEEEVRCANVVDQVSQDWEALMDDAESEKLANEMTSIEGNITHTRNEMKHLPLAQKMAKEIEIRKLQQQVIVLCKQQQHHADKVEAKRVTRIIQPVQQKVHEAVASVEKLTSKHVNSDLVEKLKKTKEEVWLEAEKVAKILEYFHNKFDTSKEMEE